MTVYEKIHLLHIMAISKLADGVVHDIPPDLRNILSSSSALREAWNDLTPLARNEWICWVISVKKAETRKNHIERLSTELLEGKHRPCCWAGCPHREKNPKKLNLKVITQ